MAANMCKNNLKNVESDNNNILYETLLDFFKRNGTYCLNKPRTYHLQAPNNSLSLVLVYLSSVILSQF